MEKGSHMLIVGDFVLNTSSRKLYDKDKKEVSLAPTLFTLLKYFIDHQNQVLSKDAIIANVWKGKIVVEANVNQNIKKLRDVLGDSANDPQYIETVTGEGFRFIANSEEYKAAPSDSGKSNILSSFGYILVPVFIIIFAVIYFNKPIQKNVMKELFPLTTLNGLEHYPNVSADGKYLLFAHIGSLDDNWGIYAKPLNKESYNPLINTEENESFPALSPDQKKLIYFSFSEKRCGLYIRDVELLSGYVGEEQLIKNCNKQAGRIRAEWINNKEIFISVNDDFRNPASIFRYSLESKRQQLISQPDSKGFGDYAFKYSKTNNKLAYIRNIGWSSSEIWTYDLHSKEHQRIKTTSINLTEIDWVDEWILFFSGTREISKISMDGRKEEIVAKFPANSHSPFVIDEKRVGVVIGQVSVADIGIFDLKSKKQTLLINSSFNDYFGFGGDSFIAFVSNRSGEPQIWIRDENHTDNQLTRFSKSYELAELSASKSGDFIVFNKSGHINVINKAGEAIFNSENYSSATYKNPLLDERNNRILYSVQYSGEWNIESRNLDLLAESKVLFKGVVARPCVKDSCIYYFKDNDPNLYKYLPDKNTSLKVAQIDRLLSINEWEVYDDDNILFLHKKDGNTQLKMINLTSGNTELILKSKANMFSLDRNKNIIYTNVRSQGNTDIKFFKL